MLKLFVFENRLSVAKMHLPNHAGLYRVSFRRSAIKGAVKL